MPIAEVGKHEAFLLIEEKRTKKWEYYFARLIKTIWCVNSTKKRASIFRMPLEDFLIHFGKKKERPSPKEVVTKLKAWAMGHNAVMTQKKKKK